MIVLALRPEILGGRIHIIGRTARFPEKAAHSGARKHRIAPTIELILKEKDRIIFNWTNTKVCNYQLKRSCLLTAPQKKYPVLNNLFSKLEQLAENA